MTTTHQQLLAPHILDQLRAAADEADRCDDWPNRSWGLLCEGGVTGWAIPSEYGGSGLEPVPFLEGLEALASACLTTTFLLSQRDAGVRRLLAGPPSIRERYLRTLVTGNSFVTVGLSQLTTSRQHRAPALTVAPLAASGYRIDGEIPWVTGADRATALIIGATLPDGMQVLFALPTSHPGVVIGPPLDLMALRGSRTALVRCNRVEIGPDWLLAGPAEKVLGPGGGGGLETSCLALGLAGAAMEFLHGEATKRRELAHLADRFERARLRARKRLHELAVGTSDSAQTLALRVECSRLALRATQVCLTVAKGAGFVAPHPTQRWARQALFFLVWSCPRPAAEGLLEDLAPPEEDPARSVQRE
jgi:alkylation response protein AidB-like acyl-CoA dehydrogenase